MSWEPFLDAKSLWDLWETVPQHLLQLSFWLSAYIAEFLKIKNLCLPKSPCSLSSPRLHQIRALTWDLAAVKEVVAVQLSLLLPSPSPAVKNEGISEAAY